MFTFQNGSKRFKKQVRPVHPNVSPLKEHRKHKMKRLMVRRKREEERGAATGAVTKSTDAAAAGASGTGPSPADVRPDQLRLGMQPWMVDGLHPSIRQMLDFKNASRGEIVHRRKINWAQLLGSSEVNTGDTAIDGSLFRATVSEVAERQSLDAKAAEAKLRELGVDGRWFSKNQKTSKGYTTVKVVARKA